MNLSLSYHTPMPIGTSIAASYVIITLSACVAMVAAAGAAMMPDQHDAFAVCGAMLGAVLAILEALKSRRDFVHLASVFIASSAVGSFGPGVMLTAVFSIDHVASMTWHHWSASGFFMALVGWVVCHALLAVFIKRVPRVIDHQFDKIDPPDRDHDAKD